MADPNKARQISEKIRQTLEKLGQSLEQWLTGTPLPPLPVPIPIERRYQRPPKN